MLWRTPIAIVLVSVSVIIHAVGLALLLNSLMKSRDQLPRGFVPIIWLLIRVSLWLIVLHLACITVWGMFYWWLGCLPDLESALYFSGVTYATIGYGDLVLPKLWRLLAPVEGSLALTSALEANSKSTISLWPKAAA